MPASPRRPISLRTRLAAGILLIVLVMSVLIGAASTMSLRHGLMDRLDSQLVAAADRAQVRRHQDGGRPGSSPDQAGQDSQDEQAGQDDQTAQDRQEGQSGQEWQTGQDSQPAPAAPQAQDGPADQVQHRLPPGLDAAGQATGTLAVVAPAAGTRTLGSPGPDTGTGTGTGQAASSASPAGTASPTSTASPTGTDTSATSTSASGLATVTAAYIDAEGTYRHLTQAQTDTLLALPVADTPVTVHVEGLPDYRVLVSQDPVSGDRVVTGLSLASDQALVRRQLLIEAGIALAGAALAAWFGRVLVRRRLAPLERVAATAQHVAAQPLARGEVSISQRVDDADLASSTEVREVGRALNTLLAHVDDALTVRQRSEEQVRQFVADASHELRTPLASVRGYTELLQRRLADSPDSPDSPTQADAEVTRALDRVHSESVRMTGLVEDLLLLARLDAGRELRREEVDLLALAADAVTDAQVARPDHTWELDLSGLVGPEDMEETGADELAAEDEDSPGLPVVQGDEARLRQVLANLLTNAAVHTPAGTHVTVRLHHEQGPQPAWITEVSDNGPGIPPGLRERVFERFARGDESRERTGGPGSASSTGPSSAGPSSTGLGTSIALAIVRSHGGTLTVASTTSEELVASGASSDEAAPSTGTTFTVRLPAA